MISKTENDLRTELIQAIQDRLPNLDLTQGTPECDLFVEAPIAGSLLDIWNKIVYTAKLFAPHVYSDDIETVDLQTYISNYGISQNAATYAEGIVTFYANTQPTQDIIIPDGTIIRTKATVPIEFSVEGTHYMYLSIVASYYNALTKRWEINCNVKAVNSGTESNVGTATIVDVTNSILGITGISNSAPVTGGEPAESITSALDRVVDTFRGRSLGPTQGLINFIKQYVTAVNVVGANDPEMLRDGGVGGAVDFYVIGEDLTDGTDTFTVTSTGLSLSLTVPYTATSITFVNQPVHEITSLTINSIIIQPAYYQLTADTGILAKSTQGFDMLTITSAGTSTGLSFKVNDSIEVRYIYNILLHTVEDELNSTANHYVNRDYLLREMTPVTVAVYMKFKELAGQDFSTIATTVETNISSFINSINNGGSVELADIIGVAKALVAVDNIDITVVSITPTGGGHLTAQGDILLDKNEYPVAGVITLVRWTS